MSRYITDEDTFRVLSEYYHHRTDGQSMALSEAISRVPTADVQEMKHGKWIWTHVRGSLLPCCSVCGSSHGTMYEFDYCPNCCAKMEE